MKKMLPQCFYQKAFWVLVPILIAATGGAAFAIEAELNGLEDKIDQNTITLAHNNVPELKQYISEKNGKLHEQLDRIEERQIDAKILLCKVHNEC